MLRKRSIFFVLLTMKKIILLFVFAAFMSCATTNTTKEIKEDQSILNGMWELAAATQSKNLAKDFTEGMPTLTFDASENLAINGYDGCNYIKTKAELKKDQVISIQKEIVSTMMSCNKVKDKEFQSWITEATHYEVTNNVLKLKNGDHVLTFHKITLGGQWVLDKIHTTKQTVDKMYPYKKPFINLDIFSTKFTGNTACNMISGMVTMYQNTMKFDHITKTEMFCDGVNEKAFTEALTKVTHFQLEGTRLVLLQKDKKLLEFKRSL